MTNVYLNKFKKLHKRQLKYNKLVESYVVQVMKL